MSARKTPSTESLATIPEGTIDRTGSVNSDDEMEKEAYDGNPLDLFQSAEVDMELMIESKRMTSKTLDYRKSTKIID